MAKDFRKVFLVEPGKEVRLSGIDPSFHNEKVDESDARADLERYKQKLGELQRLFYADRSRALLVVLQGLDASGKDGVCWHVIGAMDPLGVKVHAFKQPTLEERAHDFLWRVHRVAPAKGEVAVFNRSHYEDVLVARVQKLVPKEVWRARYDLINEWEKLLAVANNTQILKFYLHISKDEQLERFRKRLEDPARQWKISEADYKQREYWDAYIEAFETVLEKCSTKYAPWHIIPSNHKWFRNLAISQILAATMEDMKLKTPSPAVNMAEIRRLYHAERGK
jgi:PPK2 family polyphosphate:nucleotide phosphotransferase